MGKTVQCGGCGKLLDLELSSNNIYVANGKYYCFECALKLPKHIMKKCNQCKYYCFGDFCELTKKHAGRYDDACEKYESKFSL